MAYLINRNPPARIECLHNLCKFIYSKYGVENNFYMKDIKYNANDKNIFSHCNLLITNTLLNLKYCPYKNNPINKSGCSLTNGIIDDSTKSKEVSNTVNALNALGFLNRQGRKISLTKAGEQFSKTDFSSKKMLLIIQEAVLNYGMFIGILAQLKLLIKNDFDTNEIILGYPISDEKIITDGVEIKISSGSERDSNTRTKSCLLAWGVSSGFFVPKDLNKNKNSVIELYQISTRDYILSKNRNLRKYTILNLPEFIFEKNYIVSNPLNYDNLTKNTGALRENNQAKIRELTLLVEPKIKNRRYSIVYALNFAYVNQMDLNFNKLINFVSKYPNQFVVNESSFVDVMYSDLNIAFMVGVPFKVLKNGNLKPLVGINMLEVNKGAPQNLLDIMSGFKI